MAAVGEKPFSAASARKIVKRVARIPLIEPPMEYTVREANGKTHKGKFKTVAALCPGVKGTTLKRRLDNGERNLDRLRRAPQIKGKAGKRRPAR